MRRGRRFGGLPPLVVVLITMAAIVAAALVAWFMYTSTRSAASQPILETESGFTPDGQTVFFTIRNVGTQIVGVQSTGNNATCSPVGGGSSVYATTFSCNPIAVKPGESASCSFTLRLALSGDLACAVTLNTDKGGATLNVRVARG